MTSSQRFITPSERGKCMALFDANPARADGSSAALRGRTAARSEKTTSQSITEDVMTPTSSQEVSVLLPLVIALLATLATIVIHAVALAAIAYYVRRERQLGRAGAGFWKDVAIVAGVTLLALLAHLVEITIWAMVLEASGEFTRLAAAFYHSAMNYTSLGYGDIVMSGAWKLLGPLEAANGLLMFGVSTAIIFTVVQRLFETRFGDSFQQHP
jgi:hypothetical protein